MNNPKTTIFGTVASIAGAAATTLTGLPQLIAAIIASLSGSIFAYHAQDKK